MLQAILNIVRQKQKFLSIHGQLQYIGISEPSQPFQSQFVLYLALWTELACTTRFTFTKGSEVRQLSLKSHPLWVNLILTQLLSVDRIYLTPGIHDGKIFPITANTLKVRKHVTETKYSRGIKNPEQTRSMSEKIKYFLLTFLLYHEVLFLVFVLF